MNDKTKIKNCMKYIANNNIAAASFCYDATEEVASLVDIAMQYGYKIQNKVIDSDLFRITRFQKAMYVCGGEICFDYITVLQRCGYKIVDVKTLIKKFKLASQETFCKIEYSRKKNMVIATAYDEKNKYIKHTIAICSPQDSFDFEIGKKIARNRLFGIKNENE